MHPFHGTPHQETWVPIWLHLTELRQESTAAATGLAHCERNRHCKRPFMCSLALLLSLQPGGRQKARGQVKCCFPHSRGNRGTDRQTTRLPLPLPVPLQTPLMIAAGSSQTVASLRAGEEPSPWHRQHRQGLQGTGQGARSCLLMAHRPGRPRGDRAASWPGQGPESTSQGCHGGLRQP